MRQRRGSIQFLLLFLVFSTGCGTVPVQLLTTGDETYAEPACLDWWTFVHIGAGYYIGDQLDDDSFLPTVDLLTAYELTEPHFWPGFDESPLNQQCDVIVGAAGWYLEARDD